jgi:hypothetical protein
MSSALERAKKALSTLQVDYPFIFTNTGPGDNHDLPNTVTGVLRAKRGQALLVPIPNSASTVAGLPTTLRFLADSAQLIADLVEEIEFYEELLSDANTTKTGNM